jgi:predicted amidohydrolase
MRIALVQLESSPVEPVRARRERLAGILADVRDADLVVLPELWAAAYFAFDSYADHAEPLHGDTVTAAREWARALGCHVHIGSFVERAPDGRLHNTAVLIDSAGEIAHVYRKMHVFGYRSRESELLTAGDEAPVARTALGAFAATTCYDLRFPELWRLLVDGGARTVVTPAAWPAARANHWQLFTSCRAAEQQVLLIACNATGTQHGGVELAGHSRVVDPWGEVIGEAGVDECVLRVDVDPGIVDRARAVFPVLADRRIGRARTGPHPAPGGMR